MRHGEYFLALRALWPSIVGPYEDSRQLLPYAVLAAAIFPIQTSEDERPTFKPWPSSCLYTH